MVPDLGNMLGKFVFETRAKLLSAWAGLKPSEMTTSQLISALAIYAVDHSNLSMQLADLKQTYGEVVVERIKKPLDECVDLQQKITDAIAGELDARLPQKAVSCG